MSHDGGGTHTAREYRGQPLPPYDLPPSNPDDSGGSPPTRTEEVAVRVEDAKVVAGNEAVINITLDSPISSSLWIDYSTNDLPGVQQGVDYSKADDFVLFAPGEINKTVFIPTYPGDGSILGSQRFEVIINPRLDFDFTDITIDTQGSDTKALVTIFDSEFSLFSHNAMDWLHEDPKRLATWELMVDLLTTDNHSNKPEIFRIDIRNAIDDNVEKAYRDYYDYHKEDTQDFIHGKEIPEDYRIDSDGVESKFYYDFNPDVAEAGVDAEVHYKEYGWKEGRDPNMLFSTEWYLEQNPDVAAANMNPLEHYNAYGWKEGRNPSPFFDTNSYLEENPDVGSAGMNPMEHYLNWGWTEDRSWLIDI